MQDDRSKISEVMFIAFGWEFEQAFRAPAAG
jgi:hypothetical protein